MGALFTSPETSPLEAQAASEAEGLKGPTLKSPTTKRGKRDGRSYKEVLRAGPETGSMSKLRKPGAAWKFVKAPKDKQM